MAATPKTIEKSVLKKDSAEIKPRRVKNFLNNELLDHARYVIETRAMPNIMDGMRVGARKVLWAALTGDLKNAAKVKMPSLVGDALKNHYNHGDLSLQNTIVQLCSTHLNKYAPLDVIGQIDNLRGKCKTAPRYLHVKKSKYIDFFKTDFELLERTYDDGDYNEPKYFLPVVPLALVYRTNSPGFGFSYSCFSYDMDEIIDNCIKSVTIGTCKDDIDSLPLMPYVEGIKPENIIYNANKGQWFNVGEYTVDVEKDTLTITDLPYNIMLEDYDEHLRNLAEKYYILTFSDLSLDGKIKYNIQFPKGRLKEYIKDQWKFYQTMKLFTKVRKDILNFIDIDGKTILAFDTPQEVIDAFVKRRLKVYDLRKTRTIKIIKEDLVDLENKIKFITLVNDDELIISKRKIEDIKQDLDIIHKLPHDVLKLNIDKLTAEEIEKLKAKATELQIQLDYILKATPQEMYIRDLVEFKKVYGNINSGINNNSKTVEL